MRRELARPRRRSERTDLRDALSRGLVGRGNNKVPLFWRAELKEVLIPATKLKRRVGELARLIQCDYQNKDLVIVALLTGTVMFLADLLRGLELPLHLDFIGVSSYGADTRPGKLLFTKELRLEVGGRDVLLVDDILDTGRTLKKVRSKINGLKPRSVKICVLLDKPAGRREAIQADYAGFKIPDEFVVGYGLDHAERFRNLPFIGVLKETVYRKKR